MASAQVLPSSRKQALEAGKRRLEEFRKKKAADRAKKAAATTSQPLASDVKVDQQQPLQIEGTRLTDSDGAGTSDGPVTIVEPVSVAISSDNNKSSGNSRVEQGLFKDIDSNPPSMSYSKASFLPDIVQKPVNNHAFQRPGASGFSGAADVKYGMEIDEMNNGPETYIGSQGGGQYGILSQYFVPPQSQENQGSDSSFGRSSPFESIMDSAPTSSVDFVQPESDLRGSSLDVKQDVGGGVHQNGSINSDFGESKFGSYPSPFGKAAQTSESMGSDSVVRSSLNHTQLYSGTSEPNSRRSRPSFLDSLTMSRTSSGTSFQPNELKESSTNGADGLWSSTFQKPSMETQTVGEQQHPVAFSVSSSNGVNPMMLNENTWERNYSSQQNEDFTALEQHIEDLTQEKFSLQRALEASRALAESLASENSSLTNNYNQQRSTVNQLKSDMEKLQEEIKAHLVELESVKMEYGNAKLECNAADERAKILASEVIGLEEKALRLRSNELKLERQLENSNAEIASYKKKMASLERERQDLQSTIDALNEEKKLLQSKLRKASAGSKSFMDINQSAGNKKDMSTSTEDLEPPNLETVDTASLIRSDTPNFPILPGQSNPEVSNVNIPPDQMRMIDNINTLISELALEKEELVQALASESSQCSRLKDLNNELSRRLEAQTQRLELLTAQSMANGNIQKRLSDSQSTQEITTYADEGDEVVERVLGWIMKLFPGGPSRRRTSKLL